MMWCCSVATGGPAIAEDGDFLSASILGGSKRNEGAAVAVDDDGNVYTTGYFSGTADFDPGPGTFELTAAGEDTRDIFVVKIDPFNNLQWAYAIGAAGDDEGSAIAVDQAGNIAIGGYFEGAVDFSPGAANIVLTSVGSRDMFLARFTPDGGLVWARQAGDNFDEFAYDIALDREGNVFATGFFQDTVDFDPGAGVFMLSSSGVADAFVLKLDAAGHFSWARQFGGAGNQVGLSLALDHNANVFASGYFMGTVDLDPGETEVSVTSEGGRDAYVVKLDGAGGYVWSRTFGGTGDEEGASVASDTLGNPYLCGYFHDSVDFDPGVGIQLVTALPGTQDAYVVKLNAGGDYAWSRVLSGLGDEKASGIAVDLRGQAYITGYFEDVVDFDPGLGENLLSSYGAYDVFIAKFDATGNAVWARHAGGNSYDEGTGLTVNGSGRVFATGYFQGAARFNPANPLEILEGVADHDIYVWQLAGTPEIETGIHTTDQDADGEISLSELLRIIQMYNSLGYHCAEAGDDSEDGFVVGPGEKIDCLPHDSDYLPQNWIIALSELLRVIQFYNSSGYYFCPLVGSEDNFCAGQP